MKNNISKLNHRIKCEIDSFIQGSDKENIIKLSKA